MIRGGKPSQILHSANSVHKRGEEGNAGGVKWVETSVRSDLWQTGSINSEREGLQNSSDSCWCMSLEPAVLTKRKKERWLNWRCYDWAWPKVVGNKTSKLYHNISREFKMLEAATFTNKRRSFSVLFQWPTVTDDKLPNLKCDYIGTDKTEKQESTLGKLFS